MHITKECFLPFNVAFALQKSSLFTKGFSLKMNQLVEAGLIKKWTNDEFDKVAKKVVYEHGLDTQPLTVHHLQVTYLFSYIGYMIQITPPN